MEIFSGTCGTEVVAVGGMNWEGLEMKVRESWERGFRILGEWV